jgi:hypothetical protein
MSDPSTRRVAYVPRHKRKQQSTRLHGAFAGGFSAGYFNTVGSKEGWKPQLENDVNESGDIQPVVQQRPEDFMDEQDHDEWGGPLALQDSYAESKTSASRATKPLDILWTVDVPKNVGSQLLRRLGWREGSTSAYISDEADTLHDASSTSRKSPSPKRRRRIRLHQERVRIPQPKLDTCGLGYEPFQDAPEFRRHHDRRRKLAQERAQVSNHDVYRLSDVVKGDNGAHNEIQSKFRCPTIDADDPYVSYETVEDFVGKRSVGGFALHEDVDDAYDAASLSKNSGKVNIDTEAYDTVLYENGSDSEADADSKIDVKEAVGSIFAAWATSSKTQSSKKVNESAGVTSDGRSPLPGFVMGGSADAQTSKLENQRYRGPDIPQDYEERRHQFGPDEHPLVFQTLSKAEILKQEDARKEVVAQQALLDNITIPVSKAAPPNSDRPMAGKAFFSLAEAMKNRFTPEGVQETNQTEVASSEHASQHHDTTDVLDQGKVDKGNSSTAIKAVSVQRTVVPFTPAPLLCKRFHVPAFASDQSLTPFDTKITEASYFQDEILNKMDRAQATSAKLMKRVPVRTELPPLPQSDEMGLKRRPPMALYKSIFEPESEDAATSSEEDDEKDGDDTPTASRDGDLRLVAFKDDMIDEDRLVPYDELSGNAAKEISAKGKQRRQPSRSRSPANSLDNRTQKRKHRRKHRIIDDGGKKSSDRQKRRDKRRSRSEKDERRRRRRAEDEDREPMCKYQKEDRNERKRKKGKQSF